MISTTTQGTCLNCGADLHGRFCSACGQRVIPADPTLRELASDAWQELSGYDGRFARTFRMLLRHPGALTLEVLQGRRARYVSPVRVYLLASLVYFLISATAPNLRGPDEPDIPGVTVKIQGSDPGAAAADAVAEREELLKALDRAPWWARPVLRAAVLNPDELRTRMLENLPRVFFVLVPLFAGIVALFFRGRRFPQHLVFALHLHAAMFVGFAVSELVTFTRSFAVSATVELIVRVALAAYALIAFRTVYRERWMPVVTKAAGISVLYLVVSMVAVLTTLFWVTRGQN